VPPVSVPVKSTFLAYPRHGRTCSGCVSAVCRLAPAGSARGAEG